MTDGRPGPAGTGQENRVRELVDRLRTWSGRYPRIGFTCSFGGTSIVVAHLIATRRLAIPIYFLDTGLLFEETLALRHTYEQRFGVPIVDVRPDADDLARAASGGVDLFRRDPDLCCDLRKVQPMRRLLAGLDAWIGGLRRDQSPTRGAVETEERHVLEDGRIIAKLSPMAYWTRQEAWDYIRAMDLPYNPLAERGFKSIGCRPCTQPVGADEDERAGRWAGTGKTECGLHTFTRRLSDDAVRL